VEDDAEMKIVMRCQDRCCVQPENSGVGENM
jgi:hypothetical protein